MAIAINFRRSVKKRSAPTGKETASTQGAYSFARVIDTLRSCTEEEREMARALSTQRERVHLAANPQVD